MFMEPSSRGPWEYLGAKKERRRVIMHMQANAVLKNTGESIVRQHRDEMLRRAKMRDFKTRGEIIKREETSPSLFEPSSPRLWSFFRAMFRKEKMKLRSYEDKKLRNFPSSHLLNFAFFRAINWTTALDYACWGVIISALFYFGVIILAPFTVKHLLRGG